MRARPFDSNGRPRRRQPERFNLLLVGVFALLALVLAAVGLYGVTAYGVAQRTRELGIRLALGAQPTDVLRIVLGQGVRLVVVGLALGTAASLALTRLMTGLLFGIGAREPLTFAGVGILLALVSLIACHIRRVARCASIRSWHSGCSLAAAGDSS